MKHIKEIILEQYWNWALIEKWKKFVGYYMIKNDLKRFKTSFYNKNDKR